jgi:hypothetical protein
VKAQGLTLELRLEPQSLSTKEDRGIVGVEVKFVDIGKNISGEGGDLG